MKKRHLYIILLALLTSLLMLLPVFAEGMRGADPGEKPAGPPAEEELSQAAAQAESTEADLEKRVAYLSAEVEELSRRIAQLESEEAALQKRGRSVLVRAPAADRRPAGRPQRTPLRDGGQVKRGKGVHQPDAEAS